MHLDRCDKMVLGMFLVLDIYYDFDYLSNLVYLPAQLIDPYPNAFNIFLL